MSLQTKMHLLFISIYLQIFMLAVLMHKEVLKTRAVLQQQRVFPKFSDIKCEHQFGVKE